MCSLFAISHLKDRQLYTREPSSPRPCALSRRHCWPWVRARHWALYYLWTFPCDVFIFDLEMPLGCCINVVLPMVLFPSHGNPILPTAWAPKHWCHLWLFFCSHPMSDLWEKSLSSTFKIYLESGLFSWPPSHVHLSHHYSSLDWLVPLFHLGPPRVCF